jgi:hypothetical protein
MAIDEFEDMMPHEVNIAHFVSRDAYGAETHGSATTYNARVYYKPKRVRDFNGQEVVAQGMVWLASNVAVGPTDKLTMPDGSTPPILAVERPGDDAEIHHTKVYFG